MNTATLTDIVSKIATQAKNSDVSFLKDNPDAQNLLLLTLLQNSNLLSTQTTTEPQKTSVDIPDHNKPKMGSEEEVRKVGRRPVVSDDDEPENPKSKRKAQNRAAQRAFRERKMNHVRELENRVKELEEMNTKKDESLLVENQHLKQKIERLEDEKRALLASALSFNLPLSSHGDERPQKISRSSLPESAEFPSYNSEHSFSSKNSDPVTPETQLPAADDLLSVDSILFPTVDLIDYSSLLNKSNEVVDVNYSAQLNEILNEHRMTLLQDMPHLNLFDEHLLNEYNDDINSIIHLPAKEHEDVYLDNQITQCQGSDYEIDSLCHLMKQKAQCSDMIYKEKMAAIERQRYSN